MFNYFFLIQTRLKNNLKKKYSQNYKFFIIKIKKIIKNNKKIYNKNYTKKLKLKICVYKNERVNSTVFSFKLKKNFYKKYNSWRLKLKKSNNWNFKLKKKFLKIFKKKFKNLFKKIKKNKFFLKKSIRKSKTIKNSNLFFNFLIIRKRPSARFDFKIKRKMSLFLNYHPFIKFVLKKTFKNIKLFNIIKSKKKAFNFNTGFKNSKYLKFEKNSEHLNLRFSKDVIIKRIKFKNNYIKIWKNARFVFKNFYNISYKYQKQLTRKMFTYSRPSYSNFFVNFFNFKNILQSILNKTLNASVQWLVTSGFVFLNGNVCKEENKVLIINDKIALIVHNFFFKFFSFFSLNIFDKKKKIFKWFIYIFKRVKFNFFKSKKTHLSKKYMNYFNLKRDIPNFVEFEFSSLSGFIIYSDLLLKNVIKHEYIKFNLYIYRNYNWKFII